MGETVKVQEYPHCDFCHTNDDKVVAAEYDFKTNLGPWANGCERHWLQHRAFPELGTGKGQRLVLTDTEESALDSQDDNIIANAHAEALNEEAEYAGDVGEVHPGMACEEAGCFGEDL